jgi:hypothetical protein
MGIYTTLPQKRLKRAKMEVIQGYYKKVCANTPNYNPIQDIKKHSLATSYFDFLGVFCGLYDKIYRFTRKSR